MWILWTILGLIALVIVVVLLLPVHVIIKNDDNDNLLIHYRFLGKVYGEIPKPDNPIIKSLKEATGITRAQDRISQGGKWEDAYQAVKEVCDILGDLLTELTDILRFCTAKVFRVRVVCATDNAADTAITFGKVSMLVYGLSTVAESLMRVRKRGRDLYVTCDFENGEKELRYEFLIRVRIYALIPALFRLAMKEAQRQVEKDSKK